MKNQDLFFIFFMEVVGSPVPAFLRSVDHGDPRSMGSRHFEVAESERIATRPGAVEDQLRRLDSSPLPVALSDLWMVTPLTSGERRLKYDLSLAERRADAPGDTNAGRRPGGPPNAVAARSCVGRWLSSCRTSNAFNS